MNTLRHTTIVNIWILLVGTLVPTQGWAKCADSVGRLVGLPERLERLYSQPKFLARAAQGGPVWKHLESMVRSTVGTSPTIELKRDKHIEAVVKVTSEPGNLRIEVAGLYREGLAIGRSNQASDLTLGRCLGSILKGIEGRIEAHPSETLKIQIVGSRVVNRKLRKVFAEMGFERQRNMDSVRNGFVAAGGVAMAAAVPLYAPKYIALGWGAAALAVSYNIVKTMMGPDYILNLEYRPPVTPAAEPTEPPAHD